MPGAKSKHTPAPWRSEGSIVITDAAIDTKRTFGYGCGNNFICDLDDGEYHEYADDHEMFANARLIAAAPELLEALKVAGCRLMSWDFANDPEDNRAVEMIRAVIAKAEGTDL